MATVDITAYLRSSKGQDLIKEIISKYLFGEIQSSLEDWISKGKGQTIVIEQIKKTGSGFETLPCSQNSRLSSSATLGTLPTSFNAFENDFSQYLMVGRGSTIIKEICEKNNKQQISPSVPSLSAHDVRQLVQSILTDTNFNNYISFRNAVEKIINDDKCKDMLFKYIFRQDRLKNLVDDSLKIMVPKEIKYLSNEQIPVTVNNYLDKNLPAKLNEKCPEYITAFCNQLVPKYVSNQCLAYIPNEIASEIKHQLPLFLQNNVRSISLEHSQLFEQKITMIAKQKFLDFLTESSYNTAIDTFLQKAQNQLSTQIMQQNAQNDKQLENMTTDIQSSVKKNIDGKLSILENNIVTQSILSNQCTTKYLDLSTKVRDLEYLVKTLGTTVITLGLLTIYLYFRPVTITVI